MLSKKDRDLNRAYLRNGEQGGFDSGANSVVGYQMDFLNAGRLDRRGGEEVVAIRGGFTTAATSKADGGEACLASGLESGDDVT